MLEAEHVLLFLVVLVRFFDFLFVFVCFLGGGVYETVSVTVIFLLRCKLKIIVMITVISSSTDSSCCSNILVL